MWTVSPEAFGVQSNPQARCDDRGCACRRRYERDRAERQAKGEPETVATWNAYIAQTMRCGHE